MNAPKIIELALTGVLRDYGELGADTNVRPWRSLRRAAKTLSRSLPCVDIRCASAQHNEDEATQTCRCDIEIRTSGVDDESHELVAAVEESVRDTLERLYDQTKVSAGDEYAAFIASAAEESSSLFILGGFTFDGGVSPYDDDDENVAAITITVHFAKSGG